MNKRRSMVSLSLFLCGLFAFQALILSSSVEAACSSQKQCQHGALFNNNTCVCDCFTSYDGEFCQHSACTVESTQCGTDFPSSLCGIDLVKNLCPIMCKAPLCTNGCGYDSCLNGGTFNAATCSCTCVAPWGGVSCENKCQTTLACQNGAVFNGDTCMCDCFSTYSGSLCETLQCNIADPLDCASYLPGDCSVSLINSYCPHLCSRCNTTVCTKVCQNGGNLNAQCVCECYQNYNGALCENLLCGVAQPATCNDFNSGQCSITEIFNYCPVLCGKCPATTTTAPATTTTM